MATNNTNPPILTEQELRDFWNFVNKTPGQGPKGECWEWTGGTTHGYGGFRVGKQKHGSHRIAFLLANRRWPTLLVCHECDNRPCCNPTHLFEGTVGDNMRDRTAKGRTAQGEGSGRSKLTENQVREIRLLCAAGNGQQAIAKQFGISRPLVNMIVNRKWWKHI